MEIKFQPKETDLFFELTLYLIFILIFVIYNIPIILASYFFNPIPIGLYKIFNRLILPIIFICMSALLTVFFRKHIVIRSIIMVILSIFLAVGQFIWIPGIIDPVYYFILATCCSGILGFYKGRYLYEEVQKVETFNPVNEKILDSVRDGFKYVLGKSFQGCLALGASLGVSMSILFKNGYTDIHLKFMAMKMLLGFICILLSLAYWIILPSLNGIVFVHEKLAELDCEKNSSSEPNFKD